VGITGNDEGKSQDDIRGEGGFMKGKGMVNLRVGVCFTLIVGCLLWHGSWADAAETPIIEVTQGSKITVNVENSRLGEVLRLMAEKSLFEIKGSVSSREELSIQFTDLSLEEALRKLLRGYNYVLFQTEATRPPALMVMGRVSSGGGSGGYVQPSNAAPIVSGTPQSNVNQETVQADTSIAAEGIAERPVKTRRALPTRLAAHLASFRPMALQNKTMPGAANAQRAEETSQTGDVSGSGGETAMPTEPLKSDQPADTPQQPESAQTGDQGQ
jgi:hypothetical protein